MLTLHSPAKLNLFLRVLGKRPDGYHELASLFQTISLTDTLHFELSDSDKCTCTDPTLPTDGSNLIVKAVELFRRKSGLRFHVNVHLEKNIPLQAGLGGGSGNAATTLWALNQLCGKPATTEQLTQWAAEIGSDISFFFSLGTAYCTGRGEQVQAVPQLSQTKLWVVKPQDGLATPAVYQRLNLALLQPRDPLKSLESFITGAPCYFNDLEGAAFSVMPSLELLKQQLKALGFHTALMTGSGSSFFCIGNAKPPVHPGITCYPATFLNRTPDGWYGEKAVTLPRPFCL